MPTLENRPSGAQAEGASTPGHFLDTFYFVRVPDISDDTAATIGAGRARDAWDGIFRALHREERRKDATEDIRADARLGRLSIGINALARAEGITDTAMRRQLRYLQRVGLIRIHAGERPIERDPDTGKIVRGEGRTPPTVIVVTLTRAHMRPSRPTSQEGRQVTPQKPSQGRQGTPSKRSLKGKDLRDRKCAPSRESDSKESDSSGIRGTADAAGPLEAVGTAAPKTKKGGPAEGRPEEPRRTALERSQEDARRARITRFADALGITTTDVCLMGQADPGALRARVEAAGLSWETGRHREAPPPREAVLDARRAVGEAVTAATTQGADSPEDIDTRRAELKRALAAVDSKLAQERADADQRRQAEERRKEQERLRVSAWQWAIDNGMTIESREQVDDIVRRLRSGELVAA